MTTPVPRIQRVAAYNICVDDTSRLLLCRLSDITERPGWWTLPGGGINFGEHPEVAAIRELEEETGLTGRIVELLAVDSIQRIVRDDPRVDDDIEYHSVRIVYRTEITGGTLRDETDESTDMAAWCARDDVASMSLVELGRLGIELAFPQESPEGKPPEGRSTMRIPIRYGKPWSWLLPVLLLPARGAYIRIDGDSVKVRMSWAFRAKFARSDVMEVVNFRPVVSIGVHGFRGRWLVNGAHRPIAVIRLSQPVRGLVVGFPLKVREILVSVDDRDALRTALTG